MQTRAQREVLARAGRHRFRTGRVQVTHLQSAREWGRAILFAAGLLAAVVIILQLGLSPALAALIREKLEQTPGLSARIGSVDLIPWRGTCVIRHLELWSNRDPEAGSSFSADRIQLYVALRDLWQTRPGLRGRIEQGRVRIAVGADKADDGWLPLYRALCGFGLSTVTVSDGQMMIVGPADPETGGFVLYEMNGYASGLREGREPDNPLPGKITFEARTTGFGTIQADLHVAALARQPAFDVSGTWSDVFLPDLNGYLRGHAGIVVEDGSLSASVRASARGGGIKGEILPKVRVSGVVHRPAALRSRPNAAWHGVAALIENGVRNPVAADSGKTVTFSGRLDEAGKHALISVAEAIDRALIAAYGPVEAQDLAAPTGLVIE